MSKNEIIEFWAYLSFGIFIGLFGGALLAYMIKDYLRDR